MVGLACCLLALVSTWVAARRSLGHGLGVFFAWGYVYGVLRANFLDGFAHFIFDASVLGLYCARLQSQFLARNHPNFRALTGWVLALAIWPTLLVVEIGRAHV